MDHQGLPASGEALMDSAYDFIEAADKKFSLLNDSLPVLNQLTVPYIQRIQIFRPKGDLLQQFVSLVLDFVVIRQLKKIDF